MIIGHTGVYSHDHWGRVSDTALSRTLASWWELNSLLLTSPWPQATRLPREQPFMTVPCLEIAILVRNCGMH